MKYVRALSMWTFGILLAIFLQMFFGTIDIKLLILLMIGSVGVLVIFGLHDLEINEK